MTTTNIEQIVKLARQHGYTIDSDIGYVGYVLVPQPEVATMLLPVYKSTFRELAKWLQLRDQPYLN
jgi:hypothetical protein